MNHLSSASIPCQEFCSAQKKTPPKKKKRKKKGEESTKEKRGKEEQKVLLSSVQVIVLCRISLLKHSGHCALKIKFFF